MEEGQGMAGAGGQPAAKSPATRDEQVATLEAERARLGDRVLRLAAELENVRKRSVRERSEAEQRAREEVLRDVVEVVDGLERALAATTVETDVRAVRGGLELLLRNLVRRLEGYGIQAIPAVGEQFDPRRHDAVARSPTRDFEPGSIVSELQRGYLIKDRLLRPSSVVVAETPEPPGRASRS